MECIWPECSQGEYCTYIWPYSPHSHFDPQARFEVIPLCEDHFQRVEDSNFILDHQPPA